MYDRSLTLSNMGISTETSTDPHLLNQIIGTNFNRYSQTFYMLIYIYLSVFKIRKKSTNKMYIKMLQCNTFIDNVQLHDKKGAVFVSSDSLNKNILGMKKKEI